MDSLTDRGVQVEDWPGIPSIKRRSTERGWISRQQVDALTPMLKILLAASCGVHVAALVLLVRQQEPVYTYFYSLAWWSFLVAVACLNRRLGGNSLLLDRPRQFGWVFFYSNLTCWLFFEICNFRLGNWHYLGVPSEPYLRWPGYFIAFGTVLPALFEVATLLRNVGLGEGWQGWRMASRPAMRSGLPVVGGLMMAASLLFPGWCSPLIWLAWIPILDPLVYRLGKPSDSLLGRLEAGRHGLLLRWMVAGLVCGFLWEFWNFWAGSKWTYTIPVFGFWKVFEMPVVGFLGFATFALECCLLYQALELFRRRILRGRPRWMALILVMTLIYCGLAYTGIDRITIRTFKETLGS